MEPPNSVPAVAVAVDASQPDRCSIRTSTILEPYRHGQLDTQNAVYAVINALRLLLGRQCARDHYPMVPAVCEQLYREGVALIDEAGELAASVTTGVSYKLWERLVKQLAITAKRLTGIKIWVDRPFRRAPVCSDAVFAAIEVAISQQEPVLVLFSWPRQRCSVVCGLSSSRLTFFDSGLLPHVERDDCLLDTPVERYRYRLRARSLFVLRLR